MGLASYVSEKTGNIASFFSEGVRSHKGQIVIAVVLSSSLTVGSVLAAQRIRRRGGRRRLGDDMEEKLRVKERDRQKVKKVLGKGGAGREGIRDGDEDEGDDDQFPDDEIELDSFGLASSHSLPPKPIELRTADTAESDSYETLVEEALSRHSLFLTPEGVKALRKSFVIVVGLGGVGSAAAQALVRGGVGKLRLIDFDQVGLSSLNRHLPSTLASVGRPKVSVCAQFFKAIAPWAHIEERNEMFSAEAAPDLLSGGDVQHDRVGSASSLTFYAPSGRPDWVIDCIDNISTKVNLLKYCHQNDLKVFSCMGAGSKADPSRIQISDISLTFEDPLARRVRQRLKKEGVQYGIPVVYSTEKPNPLVSLRPLDDEEFEKGQVSELAPFDDFRVRLLPVLGTIPGIFGLAAASHIMTSLAGFPTEPLPIKNRRKLYAKLFTELCAREFRITGLNKIPLNEEDIAYVFEELNRGRSIVPPFTVAHRPVMCRWRKEEPVSWGNLVVFEREEGVRHEQEVLLGKHRPEDIWPAETVELVKRRQEEEKKTRLERLL